MAGSGDRTRPGSPSVLQEGRQKFKVFVVSDRRATPSRALVEAHALT